MARPVAAARRYAEAAFEVALEEGRLDEWRQDLDVAAAMLERSDVAPVVHSPAIPLEERQAVVTGLLGSRIGPGALRLVELLVARGRSHAVGRVAEEYTRRLNAHRGVVMVTVTSAVPLTAPETAAVRTRAENLAGAVIDLRTVVDPDLLGGLTIQVRDQLTDASIRGRLERLRDQLHAGGRLR